MANIKRPSLVGGTAGEPEGFGADAFVHTGVKCMRLITKNQYGVRILPAFVRDGDGNIEDQLSVASYRNADKLAGTHPEFTPWFFTVKGYKFLGREGKSFLSPLSGHLADNRETDPLFNLFWYAKNNNDWKYLTEKPKDTKEGYQAILPQYRKFGLMNAIVHIDRTGELETRLIIAGSMCMDMLKADVNRLRPSKILTPVDPNWPDYLFGDVTSPEFGSWAQVKAREFNEAHMKDSAFGFSSQTDSLIGHQPYPIPTEAGSWGEEFLKARYNIMDTEKVTKIWTAEEILDFIVSDGFIPYELIETVCKGKWEVPDASRHPDYSFPSEEVPQSDGGMLPTPAAPKAPAAPRPAAAAPGGAPKPAAAVAAPAHVAAPAAPAPKPAAAAPRPAAAAPAGAPKPAAAAPKPAAAAPKPAAAAAAPRPAAPGAAPRPPAPGGAPRPATAAKPPGAGANPSQPPRAAAPAAAPAPVAEAPAADEVPMEYAEGAVEGAAEQVAYVVTQADHEEYVALSNRFSENQESLSADEVVRMSDLANMGADQPPAA